MLNVADFSPYLRKLLFLIAFFLLQISLLLLQSSSLGAISLTQRIFSRISSRSCLVLSRLSVGGSSSHKHLKLVGEALLERFLKLKATLYILAFIENFSMFMSDLLSILAL